MISKKSLLEMVEITDYKRKKDFFSGSEWITISCVIDGWYNYLSSIRICERTKHLKTKRQLIEKIKIEFLGGLLLDRIPEKCHKQ